LCGQNDQRKSMEELSEYRKYNAEGRWWLVHQEGRHRLAELVLMAILQECIVVGEYRNHCILLERLGIGSAWNQWLTS
jgi:hypothetical protein